MRGLRCASVLTDHLTVVAIVGPRRGRGSRRKCDCKCGRIISHEVWANGMNMGWGGCEMQAYRYKRLLERHRSHRPKR